MHISKLLHCGVDIYVDVIQSLHTVPVVRKTGKAYVKGVCRLLKLPELHVEPTAQETAIMLEYMRNGYHAMIEYCAAVYRHDADRKAQAKQLWETHAEGYGQVVCQQLERMDL